MGPGTGRLFLRNFDIDNRGTLTYTRPNGSTMAGTNSPNRAWNGSGTSTQQNDDNEPGWPSSYLKGAFDAGLVQPGDQIEYTIYFLNAGGRPASDVTLCDRLQAFQTFQNTSFSFNVDAELQLGTSPPLGLTAANDTRDRAQFIAPDAAVPSRCNLNAPNNDGTFVIKLTDNSGTGFPNLTSITGSTGVGAPNDSYGFLRLRTQVNH